MRAEGTWEPDTGRDTRQRTLEEVGVRVPAPKRARLTEGEGSDDSDGPPPLEGEEGDPDKDLIASKCDSLYSRDMAGGGQGFTLLLEVLEVPEDYETEEAVLRDALLLLGSRWNITGLIHKDKDGKSWGWLHCTRFIVANSTVGRALGSMYPEIIAFSRGPAELSVEDAVRLRSLKRRWRVEDPAWEEDTSHATSGQAQPWYKRLKH